MPLEASPNSIQSCTDLDYEQKSQPNDECPLSPPFAPKLSFRSGSVCANLGMSAILVSRPEADRLLPTKGGHRIGPLVFGKSAGIARGRAYSMRNSYAAVLSRSQPATLKILETGARQMISENPALVSSGMPA